MGNRNFDCDPECYEFGGCPYWDVCDYEWKLTQEEVDTEEYLDIDDKTRNAILEKERYANKIH